MRRKLVLFMAAVVLSFNLTACGDSVNMSTTGGEESRGTLSSVSETVSESAESETDSITEATGKFDWDTAMDNFYVDGLKIEVPISMKTLGDDYYVSTDPYYDESCDFLYACIKNKENKSGFYLEFDGIDNDSFNKNSVASAMDMIDNPNIQGIVEGSSMEDVYDKWGQPDEIAEKLVESETDTAIYYGNKNSQQVKIMYSNQTNQVQWIIINF